MTDKTDAQMSGEERLRSRRKSIVLFTTLGCAVAMIAGFSTGYVGALYEDGTLPAWGVIALWALALIGFIWFNIEYFRRVDELDKQDNMFATLVAFVFYAVAYPSWYMFHDLGMVTEPHATTLYIATLAVGTLTYLARKLGLR
ncbi:hypothetical protein [Aurantiacibacter sp. D1-12]|uniref:hypothetical protein n=1 Tax=Aurantiacibacter sp. D1-12 TaxID=2993658 RepID=UPI00237D2739|nr:hypothetical protein [Aurantiacibacter sp. D1-12]MDE1466686.1 hypothetical protein [Aurantiacibacter sp. D1-12]